MQQVHVRELLDTAQKLAFVKYKEEPLDVQILLHFMSGQFSYFFKTILQSNEV